jgi:hypothetical protein
VCSRFCAMPECKTCEAVLPDDNFAGRSLNCKTCKNSWSSMCRTAKALGFEEGYRWLKGDAEWGVAQTVFKAFDEHKANQWPLYEFAFQNWVPSQYWPPAELQLPLPAAPQPNPQPQPAPAGDNHDNEEVDEFLMIWERRVRRRV